MGLHMPDPASGENKADDGEVKISLDFQHSISAFLHVRLSLFGLE